ncbi:MAG: DUF4386 domain-containing protein [Cytophagales bacterium]
MGAIGLVYAPSQILDLNDAAITLKNLTEKALILRIGIISNVLCQIAFLFLAVKLYLLFEEVDKFLNILLLSCVVSSIGVAFFLIYFQLDALFLPKQTYMSLGEMQSKAQWALIRFNNGIIFIGFFWGLWLIPFGLLALKSGYMPKIIAWLLIVGGFSYISDSFVFVMFPSLKEFTTRVTEIIPTVAELSAVFWLMIKGINNKSLYKN